MAMFVHEWVRTNPAEVEAPEGASVLASLLSHARLQPDAEVRTYVCAVVISPYSDHEAYTWQVGAKGANGWHVFEHGEAATLGLAQKAALRAVET